MAVKMIASEAVTNRMSQTGESTEERAAYLKGFTEIKGSIWISPGGFVLNSGSTTLSFIPKGQTAVLVNDVFELVQAINSLPEKLIFSEYIVQDNTSIRVK